MQRTVNKGTFVLHLRGAVKEHWSISQNSDSSSVTAQRNSASTRNRFDIRHSDRQRLQDRFTHTRRPYGQSRRRP
jgi:hypothetical protein